jgi:histidinol-phosphate aminotransferase
MKRPSLTRINPKQLVRPQVRKLHAYVPGEQPKISGLVKLNTNENPFPPSPKVFRALQDALDGRLRLYPDPRAQALRDRLARLHQCRPENVIIGNGSDDLLALATRAFVEPTAHTVAHPRNTVQFFQPSYSLYPVLADIHGARSNAVPLRPDFSLPTLAALRAGQQWKFNAALTFITTPNAPSGHGYATADLDRLCAVQRGVVVLDEAYADFARENALALALKHPHVLVSRTFSKSYSLCFLRVGYFVGQPDLIEALDKVRDSYNVNGLGQIAARAALDDRPYYHHRFRQIIQTRAQLAASLTTLGFHVFPSQTNFLLARPPAFPAEQWLQQLRQRKILVRWFRSPEVRDYLRITIGTKTEAQKLVQAARAILARTGQADLSRRIGADE